MNDTTKELASLAIQQLPSVLQLLKDWHQQANPGAPVPTNEEVIAAYQTAFQSSNAKDDAWLAAHPADSPHLLDN